MVNRQAISTPQHPERHMKVSCLVIDLPCPSKARDILLNGIWPPILIHARLQISHLRGLDRFLLIVKLESLEKEPDAAQGAIEGADDPCVVLNGV